MNFERCWDEFIEDWREREVQRRRRFEERSRRCREHEWWDPRGWVCWIVTVVRYAWEWVTETFLEIFTLTTCVLCELLTWLDYLILGHRISTSQTDIPADAVDITGYKTNAWAFNNSSIETRVSYTDYGRGFEFRIVDGIVQYKELCSGVFAPLKRNIDDIPQAISYLEERAPATHDAPRFDLLAAGGGRILAKEEGRLRFYFATLEHEFLHFIPPEGSGWLAEDFTSHNGSVPGFYAKLDPQYDMLRLLPDETLQWWTKKDYNDHPSLAPFSLLGGSGLKIAKTLRIFPDVMMVMVEPRVWHLIDDRPPFGSGEPPSWVQTYGHVTYEPCVDLDVCEQNRVQTSVKIYGVLDLAVGHMHRHLHYEDIYGGEMGGMNSTVFSIFNGPVDDADGFCDGTCNFYILCKIKVRAGLEPDGSYQDAYAVLWMDEQSYFSERWRLLHPEDNKWGRIIGTLGSPPGPFLRGFDHTKFWCPFESGWRSGRSRFDEQSRLAVSRQTVLVTGIDPDHLDHDDKPTYVIYSINFSWGTGDKTWRWRNYPCTVSSASSWSKTTPSEPLCFPRSIGIRGDMTLFIKGTKEVKTAQGSRYVNGYWYQKYLPADNIEIPIPDDLSDGDMPSAPYPHGWNFITNDDQSYMGNFDRAHCFSHFGVYQEVDSRSQFYVVTLLSGEIGQVSGVGEHVPWLDLNDDLCAWTLGWPFFHCPPSQFNERTYLKLVRREPFGLIAMHWDKRDDELPELSHTPLSFGKVTLSSRAGLVQVPPNFSASDSIDIEISLSKRFKRWTPPVVQMTKVVVDSEQQKFTILFYSRIANGSGGYEYDPRLAPPVDTDVARSLCEGNFPEYSEFTDYLATRFAPARDPVFPDPSRNDVTEIQPDIAIWRVTIAGFGPGGDVVQVFRESIFDNSGAGFIFHRKSKYLYAYEWSATDSRDDQNRFSDLREYCSEIGSIAHGTSVWFEDITGHMNTAEKIVFREVST